METQNIEAVDANTTQGVKDLKEGKGLKGRYGGRYGARSVREELGRACMLPQEGCW